MLVLRGGVDTAPRTRRAVARRLGVPVARVRRMELRGLRRARGLARAGACGEPATALTSGDGTAGAVLASTEEGGTASGAQSQSPDRAAQGEITSEQERGATRGAFAERAPQTPPALIPAQVGIPLAIALALARWPRSSASTRRRCALACGDGDYPPSGGHASLTVMDVHDALAILDLPRTEGYYDHPIPCAEDSRIGRAVKAFTTAEPAWQAAFRSPWTTTGPTCCALGASGWPRSPCGSRARSRSCSASSG